MRTIALVACLLLVAVTFVSAIRVEEQDLMLSPAGAATGAAAPAAPSQPKSVCRGKLNDCRVFDSLYYAWVSKAAVAKNDVPITATRRFIFDTKTGAVAAFQKGWSSPSRHASKGGKKAKNTKKPKFSKKKKSGKAKAKKGKKGKKGKKKNAKKAKKANNAQKSYEAIAKTFKSIVNTVNTASTSAWNRETPYSLFSQTYFVDVHDSRSTSTKAPRDRFVGVSVSRRNFIVAERLFNNKSKWLIATAQGDGVSDLKGFLELFESANSKAAKKIRKQKKKSKKSKKAKAKAGPGGAINAKPANTKPAFPPKPESAAAPAATSSTPSTAAKSS